MVWWGKLNGGEDNAAQSFLAASSGAFTNDVGKQQALFSTEHGQFFAPQQAALEADRPFLDRYVKPWATLDAGQGIALRVKQASGQFLDAAQEHPVQMAWDITKGAAQGLGQAIAHPWNTLVDAKDGFVATTQNVGEGAAATFNQTSKAWLTGLYGQDISGLTGTMVIPPFLV